MLSPLFLLYCCFVELAIYLVFLLVFYYSKKFALQLGKLRGALTYFMTLLELLCGLKLLKFVVDSLRRVFFKTFWVRGSSSLKI